MKQLLAVFEGRVSKWVSPAFIVWVLSLLVTGLSMGNPEHGSLSSFIFSYAVSFQIIIGFYFASNPPLVDGSLGHELGVVNSFKKILSLWPVNAIQWFLKEFLSSSDSLAVMLFL